MGVYTEENTLIACFRVAEDSTYSDAQDELFTLPAGNIGIPHVLEISPESAAAFGQIYTDYEQLPPFRQLDRGYYHLADNERDSHELIRWQGRLCRAGRIVGLERRGWQRLEESGSVYAMRKSTPYGDLELETEPFSLIYGETGYGDQLPVESVKSPRLIIATVNNPHSLFPRSTTSPPANSLTTLNHCLIKRI